MDMTMSSRIFENKIINLFQWLASVHRMNIALDVHVVNALRDHAEPHGGGQWIVCWTPSTRTSVSFSAC